MKLKFNKLTYDAREFKYKEGEEECTLKIRHYPSSMSNIVIKDKGFVIVGEDQWSIFNYCLVDWEGVVDYDGKPLKCTEEVKKKVFDFQLNGIPRFVLDKSREMNDEKESEEKN